MYCVWSYDDAGRITSFASLLDGTASYSYDDAHQLTAATYSYPSNESYAYDDAGNRG
jgi:YD repeat-containing protein